MIKDFFSLISLRKFNSFKSGLFQTKLKKVQLSWVVLKALQGKINPLPRSSPRPLLRFSARPLALAFFFFVFCFGKGCARSSSGRVGPVLFQLFVSPFPLFNLIFYIMSKVHKFAVVVIMPNGQSMHTTILAETEFAAIDLLYWREGFHSRQSDRTKYMATQLTR